MENDDFNQIYWSTVHDCAHLLVDTGADIETMMNDICDCLLRVQPEGSQAFRLLGILDQISQLKALEEANIVAKAVFNDE